MTTSLPKRSFSRDLGRRGIKDNERFSPDRRSIDKATKNRGCVCLRRRERLDDQRLGWLGRDSALVEIQLPQSYEATLTRKLERCKMIDKIFCVG